MIKSFIKLFLVFFLISFHNQLVLSNEALIEAVREKDIAEIQAILDSGVDPDSAYMFRALKIAVFSCYTEGMKALLGADPKVINIYGSTLLIAVARRGCIEGTELLLSLDIDPNYKNKYGDTALLSAAFNGHVEVVRLLLNAGRDPDFANHLGNTPLEVATRNNHIEIVKDLLAWGVDINPINHNGTTPFLSATYNCNLEMMEFLLAHEADPYSVNNNNETSLLIAARRGCVEEVKFLLSLGIDPNLANEGEKRTPLIATVDTRIYLRDANVRRALERESSYAELPDLNTEIYIDIMNLLLTAGANPNAIDQEGFTALVLVTDNCDIEAMDLLLAYGADTHPVNNETSFLMAASRGCVEAVRLLLSLGANPDFRNEDDRKTPLMAAVDARVGAMRINKIRARERKYSETQAPGINIKVYIDVMDLLLKAGVDPNVVDRYDFTPLMSGAIENDVEAVKLLLAHNADSSYTNRFGYSALRIANLNGDQELAGLIQDVLDAKQK